MVSGDSIIATASSRPAVSGCATECDPASNSVAASPRGFVDSIVSAGRRGAATGAVSSASVGREVETGGPAHAASREPAASDQRARASHRKLVRRRSPAPETPNRFNCMSFLRSRRVTAPRYRHPPGCALLHEHRSGSLSSPGGSLLFTRSLSLSPGSEIATQSDASEHPTAPAAASGIGRRLGRPYVRPMIKPRPRRRSGTRSCRGRSLPGPGRVRKRRFRT